MADPRPIRVVEYPGTPGDWGVVVASPAPTARGVAYAVIWHDGHDDSIDGRGRLLGHDSKRPVTVTRSRPALRRAWAWCLAALNPTSTVSPEPT